MKNSSSGFTLLEVIIAIVISLLVVAISVMALNSFINFKSKIEHADAKYGDRALFLYLLFKQLQNIPTNNDLVGDNYFYGERDYFRFVSYVPISGDYFPGIFGVEYYAKDGKLYERDMPLIESRDVRRFLMGNLGSNGTLFKINGIKVSSFEYFDGREWQSSWPYVGSWPLVVRIWEENGSSLDIPVKIGSRRRR